MGCIQPFYEARTPAHEEVDSFLAAVHGSLNLDELLNNYLHGVGSLMETPSFAVYLLDSNTGRPTQVASHGVGTQFLSLYEEAGRACDPIFAYIRKKGEPVHGGVLFNERDWDVHPFAAVLGVQGLSRVLEAPLLLRGQMLGTLNFARPSQEPQFSDQDLEMAHTVAQHLSIAIAHALEYRRLKQQQELAEATLEAMGTAVVVTDAEGRLEYTNDAARKVLTRCEEHPGLGLCVRTAMELNLADLRLEGTRATRTMRIPPRSLLDHQPYLTLRSARLLPDSGATATFLYQPGEDPNFQHLAGLLTTHEIRVLELVAQGLENKEIAECLTVSVDTVKSHLKRVFFKMQVTSRSQLLSRLFYGLPRVSAQTT